MNNDDLQMMRIGFYLYELINRVDASTENQISFSLILSFFLSLYLYFNLSFSLILSFNLFEDKISSDLFVPRSNIIGWRFNVSILTFVAFGNGFRPGTIVIVFIIHRSRWTIVLINGILARGG